MTARSCSIVIPVYRNAGSIPELVQRLRAIAAQLNGDLEVVFVVDGSPDESAAVLRDALEQVEFESQLIDAENTTSRYVVDLRPGQKEGVPPSHGCIETHPLLKERSK